MAVRHGRRVELTVACAFIDRTLANLADYRDAKAALARRIGLLARDLAPFEVVVAANAGDDEARGDVYLTVTGTSAEAGDDGQVGAGGNRADGLITPFRPDDPGGGGRQEPGQPCRQAVQPGGGAARRRAGRSVEQVEAAQCCLVSRIGQPVGSPSVVGVRLRTAQGRPPRGCAGASKNWSPVIWRR